MIDPTNLITRGATEPGTIAVIMEIPTHSDVIGWTGTILSISTAFTGAFVMIYQRIQRARRDDRVEWMKLRHGSLQALLEQANRDLAELRTELEAQIAKSKVLAKQNGDQLEQIIELTRHIIRLGALIGGLPRRLGLGGLADASSLSPESSIEALDQTVQCLEGPVEELRVPSRVLSKLTPFEPDRTPTTTTHPHDTPGAEPLSPASDVAEPNSQGAPDHHERHDELQD